MRPSDALPHPADWKVQPIGKAVEIRRGVSWSKDQEHEQSKPDTVPVLRISNVQEQLNLSDVLHLSGITAAAREQKKAGKHWSVLVGSNGNRNRIGNAVYINQDSAFLFASFLLAAKPRPESGISPDYFFRWLTSAEVQSRLTATAEGSTGLSNLSHDFFRAMKIPVPSPAEQERIATILDAADATFEHSQQAVEKAKSVKRSLVQALLRNGFNISGKLDPDTKTNFHPHIGRFPQNWQVHPLKTLAYIGSGVTLGKDLSGQPHCTDELSLPTCFGVFSGAF